MLQNRIIIDKIFGKKINQQLSYHAWGVRIFLLIKTHSWKEKVFFYQQQLMNVMCLNLMVFYFFF
jgi:hypothetical protein